MLSDRPRGKDFRTPRAVMMGSLVDSPVRGSLVGPAPARFVGSSARPAGRGLWVVMMWFPSLFSRRWSLGCA